MSSHTEGKRNKRLFIMTYLTKKEYEELDGFISNELHISLGLVRDNKTFTINISNVEVYGDVDFSRNSDDMKQLEDFDWFEPKEGRGVVIPANYDYATHTCKSPTKRMKVYDTLDVQSIFRYFHGALSKPQYIVIFREDYRPK